MGKVKRSNIANNPRNPLEQEIMDSRVAKPKNKHKIRLRAEHSDVSEMDITQLG